MALVGELFGSIVRYAGGPVTCERCPRGLAICHFHGPRGHIDECGNPVVANAWSGEIVALRGKFAGASSGPFSAPKG